MDSRLKMLVLAGAFALWACSGDSSSVAEDDETLSDAAPRTSSSHEMQAFSSEAVDASSASSKPETSSSIESSSIGSSSAAMEMKSGQFSLVCKDDSFPATVPETNKASFYNENGQDILKIEDLAGPCIKTASYSMSRAGDTLLVELGDDIDLTNCFCVSDHVFEVEKEDTDARFVKYVKNGSGYFMDYSRYADEVFQVRQPTEVNREDSARMDVNVPGDGSSSSLSQTTEPVKVNEFGFAIGSCASDADASAPKSGKQMRFAPEVSSGTYAETERSWAYLLTDGNGRYQVYLPNANDYCQVEAKVKMKREDDTLHIDYVFDEFAIMTKCLCLSDHWFDIDAENADVKFVDFRGTGFAVAR